MQHTIQATDTMPYHTDFVIQSAVRILATNRRPVLSGRQQLAYTLAAADHSPTLLRAVTHHAHQPSIHFL